MSREEKLRVLSELFDRLDANLRDFEYFSKVRTIATAGCAAVAKREATAIAARIIGILSTWEGGEK